MSTIRYKVKWHTPTSYGAVYHGEHKVYATDAESAAEKVKWLVRRQSPPEISAQFMKIDEVMKVTKDREVGEERKVQGEDSSV